MNWYAKNARELPWRYPHGVRGDPYRIWLSEIMLQQTTVVTVKSYYEKFLTKWPTVLDLAAAPVEDVMREWAGLGYYARARNLHACARVVAHEYGGNFPDTYNELLKLPGIGPYTAAAVGSIAFGLPIVPVDGNVERVMTRLYAISEPVRESKPKIKNEAQNLFDAGENIDSGDFAQALMDLGATICTPKSPKCALCPLNAGCKAKKQGNPEQYPVQAQVKPKPTRYGYVYMAQNKKGDVLLVRRPNKGLLAGMLALPTTEWSEKAVKVDPNPLRLIARKSVGDVRHSFTHFDLILKVVAGTIPKTGLVAGLWYNRATLDEAGLPRVFQKACQLSVK